MKEIAPTRREILGNNPNKPETIKSIETLQRLGVLTPMRNLDLYHGRSGHGENWQVQEVNNAGNATGNRNINKIPALHTGKYEVASDFAKTRTARERANGVRAKAEVHKITSADPDASIIDWNFDWSNLSKFEYQDAKQAIEKTLPLIFEGSPLSFEDRHRLGGLGINDFMAYAGNGQVGIIGDDLVDHYAEKYHLPKQLSEQVCGAINARVMLANYPSRMRSVVDAFTENTGKADINGDSFPINREYVATWLEKMHVVGEKKGVISGTLGRPIDTFMLFDFDRVNTEAEVEKRIKERNRRFGKLALASALGNYNDGRGNQQNGEKNSLSAKEALENPYATPKQIVDAAKKVPGFKELFEADAGNWEKFSLGEHTETVLRNFEYNYADRMPVDLLPMMKMGLLLHDIGKSEAVKRGDKNNQEQYNIFYAEKFMQAINVGDKEREFVLRMIGPGKRMVEQFLLGGRRKEDLDEIKKFCANSFQKYTGKKGSDWEAHGVYSMILALQTCDSAAYTTMALTRSKEQPGVVYRNKGVFNSSFNVKGLTRRKVNFK